jgi:hypothetical protein
MCCGATFSDAAPALRTRNPIEKKCAAVPHSDAAPCSSEKVCCATAFRDAAPNMKIYLRTALYLSGSGSGSEKKKWWRCSGAATSVPAPVSKQNVTNTKYTKYLPDPHRVPDLVLAALFFIHMYIGINSLFAATKSGQFCPFLNRSVQ